jgi:tetratricopeptide (TPR) repeat protein
MKDRYNNDCSTHSAKALEHYSAAVNTLLTAQYGTIIRLNASLSEDPKFALAHATLAHTYSMMSLSNEARISLETAIACTVNTTAREKAHINIIAAMINNNADLAFETATRHLKTYQKDAIIAQSVSGAFGLIGFSGRAGREQENLKFMEQLVPHYKNDSWFNSQYAFAISEAGEPERALKIAEAALEADPENADAVHTLAHINYETGNSESGLKALENWRSSYHRDGILHGHLAWHCALWTLEMGDFKRAFEILAEDIHPNISHSPPINLATDFIGFLIRAEMLGATVHSDHWSTASGMIKRLFPEPGLSFVDAHAAIALAKNGEPTRLSRYSSLHRGFAHDQVSNIARAFKAYVDSDWQSTINHLSPLLFTHEQLGGSRAQRDLVETVNAHCLVRLNRTDEAFSGKMQRRKKINNRIFGLN